jgi:phage protein D
MAGGYIRAPRCIISTDGGDFTPLECEVSVSKKQSANSFSATVALDDPNGLSEAYWLDTAPINVTVMATNDSTTGGYVQMFVGAVDQVDVDLANRTVAITGRDKTQEMTDQKTNEKWQNKKPEDIITELAGRSGLGVQIDGSSQDKAGLKYKDDYNRISEYDSHWNMIVRLAKSMGCIAFVYGTTVYVQPYDSNNGGTYQLHYQAPTNSSPAQGNFTMIRCGRQLNLSKTVKVKHQSWRHKEGEAIKSEFSSQGKGSGNLEYTFKGANLTKQQQDQLAKTKLNEILSHERSLSIEMPGDVTLTPLMSVALSGTGTSADQDYLIQDIHHHWSFDGGYMMSLDVRNQDSSRGGASQDS